MRFQNGILLGILLTGFASAAAQTLPRPLTGPLRLTGADMLLFEDVSGQMDLTEVISASRSGSFHPSPLSTPYYGFTKSAIWVKLDLRTADEGPREWFIEIAEPLLHEIELYGPVPGGIQLLKPSADTIPRRSAGRLLPFRDREVEHRKILFPVSLTRDPQTYFLRIHSRDNVVVPIQLWPRRDFFLSDIGDTAWRGIFYGIIAALIAYNCFVFLSLRDINYLYYILYAFSFGVFQSAIDGSLYQILPGLPAWLKWRLPLFSGVSAGAFMLFFTRNFLFMREAPAWFRWVHWVMLGAFAALVLGSVADSTMPVASRYANLQSTLLAAYGLGCGAYRTIKKYPPARYYLVAWLALLTGITGAGLVNLGLFPPNLTTKYWTSIGFVAELLLFSFALADRITLLRKKKEEADRRTLEIQQKAAAELEGMVADRTRELSYANATKDKFFSIIAHDLRGPIGSLAALMTDAVGDDGTIDTAVLQSVRTTTKNSYHLLEDLLTWAKSQRGEIDFQPEPLDLRPIVDECITLTGVQARNKGIRLTAGKMSGELVVADRAMIALVIRNLISNAVKFTLHGGDVKIAMEARPPEIEVRVTDSGIGVPTDLQSTLFRIDAKRASRPGTDNEEGSGLGLILCREFVERHGGRIGVASAAGEGSTFWFTLPRKQDEI